jgi:hypothetical protein
MSYPMHRFDAIDWTRPWYAAIRERGQAIAQADDWRATLNAAATELRLRNHRGLPLSFVLQQVLPNGTAYEAFISATGQVPTRDNLHDFFNALVWLTFPSLKTQLNALQAAEIARTAAAPARSRGPLRDAATLFDENAALVVLRDSTNGRALADALRQHRWREVFIERAPLFGPECHIVPFGHALLEKLVAPYKAITAHAWLLMAQDDFFVLPAVARVAWLDAVVARQLAGGLQPRSFTPLPVLGVPEWADGQDQMFYADTAVFRPPRNRIGMA